MLPKDYLAYRLSGSFCTDVSDASGMLLLDVKNRCWSKEMMEICGVKEEQLPKVYESWEVVELRIVSSLCPLDGGPDHRVPEYVSDWARWPKRKIRPIPAGCRPVAARRHTPTPSSRPRAHRSPDFGPEAQAGRTEPPATSKNISSSCKTVFVRSPQHDTARRGTNKYNHVLPIKRPDRPKVANPGPTPGPTTRFPVVSTGFLTTFSRIPYRTFLPVSRTF